MIEKTFEGKSWVVVGDCHIYLCGFMGIEKDYKITIKIEEL